MFKIPFFSLIPFFVFLVSCTDEYRCDGDTIQKRDSPCASWEDWEDCGSGEVCLMEDGDAICAPYDDGDRNNDYKEGAGPDETAGFLIVRSGIKDGCFTVLYENGGRAFPMTCMTEYTFTLYVPMSGQADFFVRCEASAGYTLPEPVTHVTVFAGETAEAECGYTPADSG